MAKTRRTAVTTPYPGPTVCMDLDPEELLRRLAYGERAPMLAPKARLNGLFFARLLDEMANSHTVLVKRLFTDAGAYKVAKVLRDELPAEAFGVHVDHDKVRGEWNVIVHHSMPREIRVPRKRDPEGDVWIGPAEVGRVLGVGTQAASRAIDRAGIPVRRVGGKAERQIRQRDLAVLVNWKGRWRRRTRKVK